MLGFFCEHKVITLKKQFPGTPVLEINLIEGYFLLPKHWNVTWIVQANLAYKSLNESTLYKQKSFSCSLLSLRRLNGLEQFLKENSQFYHIHFHELLGWEKKSAFVCTISAQLGMACQILEFVKLAVNSFFSETE